MYTRIYVSLVLGQSTSRRSSRPSSRRVSRARVARMSVHDRFPHSTCELQSVRAVQFGVLSPDEIVRDAARGFPDDLAADARLLLRAMRATEDARGPRTDETNESRSLPRSVRCRCARSRRARRTTRDAEARRVVGSANGDDGSRCGVRNGRVRQRADAGILWTPRTGETGVSSRIYQRGVEDIAVRGARLRSCCCTRTRIRSLRS